jgi:hypothetical protein
MVMRPRSPSAHAAIAQGHGPSSQMRRCAVHVKHIDMKSLQSDKIKELGDALIASGLASLDQQAEALGLSRSTAWTVLNARHKASGLSASVVNQMLMATQLPPLVRAKLFEYIEEKIARTFGHSALQVRRFVARLVAERASPKSRDGKHLRQNAELGAQVSPAKTTETQARWRKRNWP